MQRLEEKLKELGFKFTNKYTSSSSYIMQDGSFLNLNEQYDILYKFNKTYRNNYHGQLDKFIKINKLLSDEDFNKLDEIQLEDVKNNHYYYIAKSNCRYLKFSDNAITINAGTGHWENCYIDLPYANLSSKQYESLTTWLDELVYTNNKRNLAISLDSKFKEFNLDDVIVDDIIKEIKRMYNETSKN